MTGFVCYDDSVARGFEPFALTRPISELRGGALLIRERWAMALGAPCDAGVRASHLAQFRELDAPPEAPAVIPAGAILVNSRCLPALALVPTEGIGRWSVDGRLAAVRLATPLERSRLVDGALALEALASHGEEARINGWWCDAIWDLIRWLSPMLQSDALALMPSVSTKPEMLTVLGTHRVHVDEGATIEPFVIADAQAGPILIRRGATVQGFTRLVGPCVVGEGSTISGGRVAACSIGDRAKVNGEISMSIVLGHANKGHDGFVGHSIIGRWANLGAGTTTSNLKNSYGTVALWTPSGIRDTGLQFLGSLIGDHAKTGIGTRLTTGCVVGAGANLFGTSMPPKVVPPFAWGDAPPWNEFRLPKFLEVAERVMARRAMVLDPAQRACLSAAFAARWTA